MAVEAFQQIPIDDATAARLRAVAHKDPQAKAILIAGGRQITEDSDEARRVGQVERV